jgi:cytochrome c-type biogenesis protein CcmH
MVSEAIRTGSRRRSGGARAQRKRLALVLFALLLVVPSYAPAADAPTFQELEESLTCQCGCGLTVHSCNHLQCPSALPLRQEIRDQMALGLDRDAILAHFAGKYGEKILSSPTTSGFNLTAWITPFVALLLGALLVAATLRRWRRERPRAAAPPPLAPVGDARTLAYEQILERELKQLEP